MTFQPASPAPAPAPAPAPRLPAADRIDWTPLLAPRGRWSALVTPRSSPDRVARHGGGRLVYVSAPYLQEAQVRGVWRVERSVRVSVLASIEVSLLAAGGCTALCPAIQMAEMAHARALTEDSPAPLDARFWAAWSQPILNAAALIAIPAIEGWDRCPTVWREMRFGLEHGVPVHVYGEVA